MITDWAPEDVVVALRAADAAAQAARAVPGVARLQPGVWGLLAQLAAQGFEQATGRELPDIAGVQADLVDLTAGPDGGREVRIELRIVVDGGYQAATVGAQVAHAVGEVVPAIAGIAVRAVRVHIVEVEVDLA